MFHIHHFIIYGDIYNKYVKHKSRIAHACMAIQNCKTDPAKTKASKLPLYFPNPPKMLSGFSFNYMAMNIIKFQYEPAMHWGKSQSFKGCTAIFRLVSLASASPVITSNVAHTVHYRDQSVDYCD